MTDAPGSPRAVRLAAPRWRDGRLVLGVLLVLVSVLAGSRVLADADTTQQVWVASHDLAPGTVLADGDLRHRDVRLLTTGTRYVAGPAPVGYVVLRSVGTGELLPVGALAAPGDQPARREVTVPVEAGHLPPDLARGDQVDVYVTPDDKTARRSTPAPDADPWAPRLVLRAVPVVRVLRSGGLASGGQDQPVVLGVDPGQVLAVVQALGEGRIDLVRVPRQQQGSLVAATAGP